MEKEEIYWVQRARANWHKFGDRNAIFFNNFAMARKKRNFIRRLMNENGDWKEDNEAMKLLIVSYFQHLFSAKVHTSNLDVLDKSLAESIFIYE